MHTLLGCRRSAAQYTNTLKEQVQIAMYVRGLLRIEVRSSGNISVGIDREVVKCTALARYASDNRNKNRNKAIPVRGVDGEVLNRQGKEKPIIIQQWELEDHGDVDIALGPHSSSSRYHEVNKKEVSREQWERYVMSASKQTTVRVEIKEEKINMGD